MDVALTTLNIINSALILPTFAMALTAAVERCLQIRLMRRFWARSVYPLFGLQGIALLLAATVGAGVDFNDPSTVHVTVNAIVSAIMFAFAHADYAGRAIYKIFADPQGGHQGPPEDAGPRQRPERRPDAPGTASHDRERPPYT